MDPDLVMAARNIRRNPRRTLLTLSAIAFACLLLVFMFSFQFGSYETMINASVGISTGHFQILAAGYSDRPDIRKSVENPDSLIPILEALPGVQAFTFRAETFSLASSKERTRGIQVVGIDPEREPGVSTLKALVRTGDFLSPGDHDQALVGKLLAQHLKITINDEVTLIGQAWDGSVAATIVRVKGLYSSGIDEFDRSSIQIPLDFFQDVYGMGTGVHRVVAVCTGLSSVASSAEALRSRIGAIPHGQALDILDWKELMPGLVQGITMDLASGVIFYLILIIIVAFSILNTFLMALFERTREFGILLAMGARPMRLFKLLFMESLFLTTAGAILGTLAGCGVTAWFQATGIDISGASEMLRQYGISGIIYPRLSILSAAIGPAAVICITMLTALYPAIRATRLTPVEAMAHG